MLLSRGNIRRYRSINDPISTPSGQLPFDLFVNEPEFALSIDEPDFTEFLLNYHESLLPSSAEQQTLTTVVSRLCETVENLIVSPTGSLAKQIEEIRPVGSFKLGTWLAGHNTADVVLVTRILPTGETIKSIQQHVENRLSTLGGCSTSIQYYGFSVTLGDAIVRVFVSTKPENISKSNAEIHVNPTSQHAALAAVRQARWSEENVSHSTVKVLIRIVKDFRRRFKAFQYLSSWVINLLAVHAAMQYPARQPLTVNQAFKRLLQLLASGLFLPGSSGLVDPCEPVSVPLHSCMSLAEQDELCCTAQTLLRALLVGAYEILFTFDEYAEGSSKDRFAASVTNKTGLVFQWSDPVVPDTNIETPSSVPAGTLGVSSVA